MALCWYGVGNVLWSTASPPRHATAPASPPSAPGPGETLPESSSTRRPVPDGTSTESRRPPSGPTAVASRTVHGGRVAFDLGRRSARLVSATPRAGWRMRIVEGRGWIKVTFTSGDRATTVRCAWRDGDRPRLRTYRG